MPLARGSTGRETTHIFVQLQALRVGHTGATAAEATQVGPALISVVLWSEPESKWTEEAALRFV